MLYFNYMKFMSQEAFWPLVRFLLTLKILLSWRECQSLQPCAVLPDTVNLKPFSSNIKPCVPCAKKQAGCLPNTSEKHLGKKMSTLLGIELFKVIICCDSLEWCLNLAANCGTNMFSGQSLCNWGMQHSPSWSFPPPCPPRRLKLWQTLLSMAI